MQAGVEGSHDAKLNLLCYRINIFFYQESFYIWNKTDDEFSIQLYQNYLQSLYIGL